MGIPSYFSNIVKRHKSIIKRLAGLPQIHNLYMDTNGLIYDAVRVVGSNRGMSNDEYETLIIDTVCNKIDEYLALFRPSDKLMIAFDGVAPVAKLNQQRERRYKSWFTSVVEDTITRKNALLDPFTRVSTAGEASTHKSWNTSSITPGTAFMTKLNTRMHDYCKVKAREIGNRVAYIYFGSDVAGEGEHKIFEYIRENAEYHRDTTTLIYGLDADLIMLCLNHLHISQNIYLYRDTPEFIQSLDSTLSSSEQYYIDIPEFACSLEAVMREETTHHDGVGVAADANMKTPYISDTTTTTKPAAANNKTGMAVSKITPAVISAIDDYIVMAFMLGNDFMPHFPSFNLRTNGMTVLLQTYANMLKNNKDGLLVSRVSGRPTIIWKNMRTFIGLLAETEHNRFMNEHKTRDRQSKMKYGSGSGSGAWTNNNKNKSGKDNDEVTTKQPPVVDAVVVDIRELTKIACNRVVQMVGNIERCHSLNEFMTIPLQERAAEKYIDPFRENWEFRYYDALFGIDIYAREREGEHEREGEGGKRRGGSSSSSGSGSVDRLQMICVNYIEGLEWTMRYYSTGCVDWRWTYKYPYAPLLVDLMRYMPHLDTALFPNATVVKNPVRDLVQLCYVLPMASHGLLPPLLAEKLKRYYSYYYCDKLDFKWSYCKYFWEAHTELPHIRISELERVVAEVA